MLHEPLLTDEDGGTQSSLAYRDSVDSSLLSTTLSFAESAIAQAQKLWTLETYARPLRAQYTRRSLFGLMLYLLVGVGYYHGHQRLTVLDSIYFSVVTLITIGYGDIRPGSTNERIFTAIYVIFGVFLLSAAIASVSSAIYSQYVAMVEDRLNRTAERMRDEKHRQSMVSMMPQESADKVLDFLDINPSQNNSEEETLGAKLRSGVEEFTAKIGIGGAGRPEGISLHEQHQHDQRIVDALHALSLEMFDEDLKDMKMSLMRTFLLILSVVIVGWFFMWLIEDWNFGDAFYWSIVTITTVGFGDIVPKSHGGKIFTIVYGLIGCALLAKGLNTLVAYPLTKKSKQSELKVMLQFGGQLSEETLQKLLSNDFFHRFPNLRNSNGSISRSEFILLVLSMTNKAFDKDLILISSIFDVLDKNKEGSLSALSLQNEIQSMSYGNGNPSIKAPCGSI